MRVGLCPDGVLAKLADANCELRDITLLSQYNVECQDFMLLVDNSINIMVEKQRKRKQQQQSRRDHNNQIAHRVYTVQFSSRWKVHITLFTQSQRTCYYWKPFCLVENQLCITFQDEVVGVFKMCKTNNSSHILSIIHFQLFNLLSSWVTVLLFIMNDH